MVEQKEEEDVNLSGDIFKSFFEIGPIVSDYILPQRDKLGTRRFIAFD